MMKKVLWVFFLVAFLCAGCTAKTPQANTDLEAPTSVPENQTKISLSHNDKYRGEAYGTITTITAGGLYPYEGIRVVDTSNDEVLWKMEPGYYVVDFAWSPEDRYVGIYYEARIYGESIVFDTHDKKVISLPNLEDIAAHYGQKVKPQENRPDPYFKITGWENPDTAIVEFRWNKEDADYFEGSFTFNVKTGVVAYKSNIQAANRVDIFYGYSSYAMSEYKIETAQFLSEQFNKLSFIPTDKKMDYATMLKVYFYWNEDLLVSISVDKNGVFFLNGTIESYEISSGSFDYDLIKEVYDKSRNNHN